MDYMTSEKNDIVMNAPKYEFEMLELDLFEKLEENYDCSGMCESALFFYSQELSNGYPVETCLMHLKDNISSNTVHYAQISVFSSIIGLGIFFTHFFMYQVKSETHESRNYQYQEADYNSSSMAGASQFASASNLEMAEVRDL